MITTTFEELKKKLELNPSLYEKIKARHKAVRSVVEQNIPDATTRLIGSLGRKTRIHPQEEGELDIDILVVLGNFHRWAPEGERGVTPNDAIMSVHEGINDQERYEKMDTEIDEPTVIIKYQDKLNVEFVPAYRDHIGASQNGTVHGEIGRGYWVAKNNKWALADYDYEADTLSELNQLCDGKLIPALKMLKSIKNLHCPDLSSFHLEMNAAHKLAVRYTEQKNNGYIQSFSEMLLDYLKRDPSHLHTPVKLLESKTPPVHLDASDAHIVAKFNEIRGHCSIIEMESEPKRQLDLWKALFGKPFPSNY